MTREAPGKGQPAEAPSKGSIDEPQIKGIAVRDAVDALLAKKDEALEKLPERLHHYLDGPILVSSWYPETDHLELLEAIAELYGRRGKDVWFWMGQSTATTDLGNLYKAMVQEGSPITTLKRFPKLWRLYRSSGRMMVQTIGSTKGLVRLYDYPYVDPRFAKLMAGYLSQAIVLSGGENVLVNPTSLGKTVGAPAIWAVSWR